MDSQIRKLQREAIVDPLAYEKFLQSVKRIGRNALIYIGPNILPPKPPDKHQIDRVLKNADPWVVGFKKYAKVAKSRAHRRMGKDLCRNWEYWE
jgi:hypothetical protein